MGLIVNCILLMLSAVVFVLGVSFFMNNKGTEDKTRFYILFLSFFATVWCAAYGSIGITDKIPVAEILRIFGVFSVNAFLVAEVFLFTGLSRMKLWISHTLRTFVTIMGAVDFFMYSKRKVDLFVRVGNWTTWEVNPDYATARYFHTGFVVLYFLILLITGITWARKNNLRRQRRFITLAFMSNFILIFFSLPDTFLPLWGIYPVATSGLGAALCAIVTWYAATQLNAFNIRMGTISRILYEFINAGAVVFDTDHRIVLANPYAQQSTESQKLEGRGIEELFEIESDEGIFEKALEDKYNNRLIGKGGDRVYSVSISAANDNYGDPYCYLCVFVDVTSEADAIRELEIANNAKMDFLTSISHEIRTPINSIIGFNEMIIRDSEDDDITGYAGNAERASKQLLSIVNDLLDMGQITSGKLAISEGEYDMGRLLRDIYDTQKLRAEEKNLKFTLDAEETIPCKLIGDEVRIQQIITNLVTNAIKYTPEGSVTLSVSSKQDGDKGILLTVKVTDTGIGIREENIPHLYDVFSRFDKKAHRYIEGTGVGLAVTKSIVDMMGGSIEVKSIYGRGSTFTVTIPQEFVGKELLGSRDDSGDVKAKAARIDFKAPKAKILVVDDNEMNRMVFKGQVKPIGVQLDLAESGLVMLDLIHQKKYDIIFLDHMMPGMDGVEALERMKKDDTHPNGDTPVIVMTANAGRGARERYIEMGFDDYISKPAGIATLIDAFEKYLDPSLMESAEQQTAAPKAEKGTRPKVAGIDWKAARANVPDDEALSDLMKKFVSLADHETEELDGFYSSIESPEDEEAIRNYRVLVHSMKNSAALIGATELSLAAKELEIAADEKDVQSIKTSHENFINEYREMAKRLRSEVVKEDTGSNRRMSEKILTSYIEKLEDAMAHLDMMKVNEMVFEMSSYGFESDSQRELAKKLFAAVRDFDMDGFSSAIKGLRETVAEV